MGGKILKREREASTSDNIPEKSAKKPRQVKGDEVNISKLLADLAADSDEVRLKAAKDIIVRLSPKNNPSAEAVEQALKRLVRGLCSPHKAARVGFCITLTELLRQVFGHKDQKIEGLSLDIKSIITLIEAETLVKSRTPKLERRNRLLGRLFGCKAIIQSDITVDPNPSLECWNTVLDHIYKLAREVPWLREECGLVLVEAVKNAKTDSKSQSHIQELIQRLSSSQQTNTPQGVAIWLAVRARFQNLLPAKVWNNNDPLSKQERGRLAKVLREDFGNISDDTQDEAIKAGGANPNPIFAWDLVLSEILCRDDGAAKPEFPQFWLDIVDNNLFSSSASPERKSWGFKILARQVSSVPDSAISALFSPNLMRSLINQSKEEERYLHAAAIAALKAVQHRAQDQPDTALPIFITLTSNGAIELEKLTKAKVLENIMLSADDKTLRKLVRHLHSLILRPDTKDQSIADDRRQTIANLLLNTVRQYKHYESNSTVTSEEHDTWLRRTLDLLVEHAYFIPEAGAKTSKVPLPPISDTTRKVFQERLASCLTRLLTVETKSSASFALLINNMVRAKATSPKEFRLVFKADKSVRKTIEKACQSLDAISVKKKPSKSRPAIEGLILLYCFTLLQVYDGDGEAVLLLDDLDAARESLLKSKGDSTSEEQRAFVEVILTFLGNPRTLFRNIAQEAFGLFSADITSEDLQSLAELLDTEENEEGQKQLFNQGGDEDEIASDEDDEEASDVEMIDGADEGPGEADSAGSSDESSSEDDDSADEEEDEEELLRFNNLLAHTLQTSKPSLGDESASEESSEESDMDDDQMMALDEQLAKIFKERSKISSKKKDRTDAKQAVVQFKSRVLDLLGLYMERQYSNALALQLLVPVLRLIRAGANKQLTEKSFKLLKIYTDARSHHKAPLPRPDDVDSVWEVLSAIHEEVKQGGGSALHAKASSNASLHVVKILVGLDKNNYAKVVDAYSEMQKSWFLEKKSKISPLLFTMFQSWSMSMRK
ncbi:DNA polymerase phi-domain-containing protein [Dendryphion nanum]|uniref:DNA polymerase phi-domain-containing protein n=1 Tax=Dendryphion nanum TaxID=256645 RepID=A0A9P9IFR2_9PLEO|nr:DNA polymerase phi-domain-containing protein [Dendryphion nanum]